MGGVVMPTKSRETFADRLASLMAERGLTAYALAKKCGITQMSLLRILKGQQPKLPTLFAVADALGVSLAAFDDCR
jgi:transcriptional regulator with XRE-family HTH domain